MADIARNPRLGRAIETRQMFVGADNELFNTEDEARKSFAEEDALKALHDLFGSTSDKAEQLVEALLERGAQAQELRRAIMALISFA